MWLDAKFGLRRWRRHPGIAITIVSLLALSIAANTLIFSFIESLLLKALPVRDPANLYLLEQHHRKEVRADTDFLYPVFENLRGRRDVFPSLVAEQSLSDSSFLPFERNGQVRVISTSIVSPEFFSELGLHPVLGRLLTSSDAQSAADIPVVISYQFWRSEFSGRTDIIGKDLRLKNFPFRIAGVLPRDFHSIDIEQAPDVRLPLPAAPILHHQSVFKPTNNYGLNFQILVRLQPVFGAMNAAAAITPFVQASNRAAYQQLPAEPGISNTSLAEMLAHVSAVTIRLTSITRGISRLRGQFSQALYLLMGGSILLLFSVCANVSGLLLALNETRRREIATRFALGARRMQLARMMLAECLPLTAISLLLAIACSYAGAPFLVGLLPPTRGLTSYATAPVLDVRVDPVVLTCSVFAAAVCLGLISLMPALQIVRTDLNVELKSGGRTATGSLSGLTAVTVQIALGVLLTAAAALIIQTFSNLEHRHPGFDRTHTIEVNTDPDAAGYSNQQAQLFIRAVRTHIAALPGVDSVSSAAVELMSGFGRKTTVVPQGGRLPESTFLNTTTNNVSAAYFQTLGIPLLAGRNVQPGDEKTKPRPVVINTALAKLLFANQNALGKALVTGTDGHKPPDYQVVGLTGTASFRSLREEEPPTFYAFGPDNQVLYAKTSDDPRRTLPLIRDWLRRHYPDVPVIRLTTLEDKVQGTLWQERLLTFLAAFFGIVALSLAFVSVQGALAYSVSARERELGIRVALGAQQRDIVQTISSRVLVALSCGLATGLLLCFFLLGASQKILFGVQPRDGRTFTLTLMAVLACSVCAALLPLWRAVRTEPARALRAE